MSTRGEAPFTFQQVGTKAGGALDGGAVPPHACEGPLAGAHGLGGSLDDAVHHLQVPPAHLDLVGHQPSQQPAVVAFVPGHPAAALRQPPVGRGEGRGDRGHWGGGEGMGTAGDEQTGTWGAGDRGQTRGVLLQGTPGGAPLSLLPLPPPLHPVTHSHWMAAASPSWQSRMAVGTAGWPMAGDRTAGPGQAGTRAARPLYTRGRCRPAPRGGEQRRFRCHSQLAALREDGEAAPAPVLQPGCLGTPVSAAWSGGSLFRYPRCRCGCPQSGISLGKKPRQHRAAPCNVVAEGAWALPCPPCAPLSAPRPQTTSQPSEALRRPRHRTHAALPG